MPLDTFSAWDRRKAVPPNKRIIPCITLTTQGARKKEGNTSMKGGGVHKDTIPSVTQALKL